MTKIGYRLLLAFMCIVFFLIIQGVVALNNTRWVMSVQELAQSRRLEIEELRQDLFNLRLTVLKVTSTMDPHLMDEFKRQYEQEVVSLVIRLKKHTVPEVLIREADEVYRRTIWMQYQFAENMARDLFTGTSQELHDQISTILERKAREIEDEAQAKIDRARVRAAQMIIGLCILALITAFLWAFVLMRTMTDKTQAERRIRKYQEGLEKMVEVRTAELREEIRERQMAELALNESKQRFQDIVETVSDWFWEMDQELRFCYLSDTFFEETSLNREDIIGKTRWEFASKESLDQNPEGWQQHKDDLINHRPVHDFEYMTHSLDGSKRYLRVNGKAIFSESGDFVGYRGATTDVTEQKSIELALQQSEERFRDIAQSASDWFWETDAEHRFSFLSGRYQQATGIHTTHVMGNTRLEFLEKYAIFSSSEAIVKHKKDLSEHKPFTLAYRVTNREGGYTHVRINGKPIFDSQDNFIGYRGAGSDVTSIVIAGMALRVSEERFRQIVEGVGEEYCFYSLDARGCFSFHSPSLLRWFDLPVAGLKGLNWEWVTALDVSSKVKLREATTVCIRGERPAPFLIRSSKRYGCKTYEVSQRPVHCDLGRVTGVDGIVRDISVQVQSEEALKRAKEQAEKAAEAKSEFLANMSHEIRTPLNAVTGFSELLSTMVTDTNQRQYLDAIKTAGNSLLTLINDILDLSKIEANMLTMNYQPVPLKKLLGEIEQIFRAKVNNKKIAFSVVIDPQLPEMLIIDEVRVRQVLLNLVGNSVKFTDKGYIEVSARLDHFHGEGNLLEMILQVRDSGIGIEAGSIQDIFEPFRQNEIPDTRKYGGTGLGLAICRRLVEAMDGEISAASEVGTGTLFEVRLNNVGFLMTASEPGIDDKLTEISRIHFNGATVLVVDDVDSNISLLIEILTLHNLKAVIATNGAEALDRLDENTIDLIIMDIRMPVMDGITASQRIRENPFTRHIPIIALTASTLPEEREAIMSKGFDGYLTKPIKITTLIAELASYLEHSTFQTTCGEDVEESAPLLGDLIRSPQLRLHLEQHMLPMCRSISTTLLIDEVMDFAKALQELGSTFANDSLAAFGKGLKENVQAFDIAAIREKLEEFQTSIIPETKEG